MSEINQLKLPLLTELDKNIERIRELCGGTSDLLVNKFVTGGIRCALLCCEGWSRPPPWQSLFSVP